VSSVGTLWTLSNPSKCSRFVAALLPNILLEVSVPNTDCDGQSFPQLVHVAQFQSLFSELCGGHAPPLGGPGRYQPPGEVGMSEYTVVIRTYLPEIVTNDVRQRLLVAILDFGEETRQQEVLVAVGVFAFRFRFNVRSQAQESNRVVPGTKVA
jgi:hypothetical protein